MKKKHPSPKLNQFHPRSTVQIPRAPDRPAKLDPAKLTLITGPKGTGKSTVASALFNKWGFGEQCVIAVLNVNRRMHFAAFTKALARREEGRVVSKAMLTRLCRDFDRIIIVSESETLRCGVSPLHHITTYRGWLRYVVTMKHDKGRVHLAITAPDEESAKEMACTAERAPLSAVLRVRQK